MMRLCEQDIFQLSAFWPIKIWKLRPSAGPVQSPSAAPSELLFFNVFSEKMQRLIMEQISVSCKSLLSIALFYVLRFLDMLETASGPKIIWLKNYFWRQCWYLNLCTHLPFCTSVCLFVSQGGLKTGSKSVSCTHTVLYKHNHNHLFITLVFLRLTWKCVKSKFSQTELDQCAKLLRDLMTN